MLINASVRPLSDRPPEGFLLLLEVLRVAGSESQEIALLRRRPAADHGRGLDWVQVWGSALSAMGLYEAVVGLPTQAGDRLRLQGSFQVLREWTVDW